MTKVIGIGLLLLAGYLITQNLQVIPNILRTPAQTLKVQIENDVEHSLVKSGLPASNGIHHVDIKYRSKKAHDFLNSDQPNFKTSRDGKIWIEIEVIDLPDTEAPAIITQTSVFDKKSNNKISEFGQKYGLKEYGLETEKHKK
jgi:hypothetical protein